MNKTELQKKLLEDNDSEYSFLNELKSELNDELQKPFKKRDFNKIEELTQSIRELTESEISILKRNEKGIAAIKEKAVNYDRNSVGLRFKNLTAIFCVCLAAFICLNLISFRAWGMNLFSAIIELNKGSISINFGNHNDTIDLPASPNDPYGIIAKCAEYGLSPETPKYLPENFKLIDFEVQQLSDIKTVIFYYKNNNTKLNLQYQYSANALSLGIPSDSYNVTEEIIKNHSIYIIKEDDQFTATYIYDDIVYFIYADNLDYDECYKIIESFD